MVVDNGSQWFLTSHFGCPLSSYPINPSATQKLVVNPVEKSLKQTKPYEFKISWQIVND